MKGAFRREADREKLLSPTPSLAHSSESVIASPAHSGHFVGLARRLSASSSQQLRSPPHLLKQALFFQCIMYCSFKPGRGWQGATFTNYNQPSKPQLLWIARADHKPFFNIGIWSAQNGFFNGLPSKPPPQQGTLKQKHTHSHHVSQAHKWSISGQLKVLVRVCKPTTRTVWTFTVGELIIGPHA